MMHESDIDQSIGTRPRRDPPPRSAAAIVAALPPGWICLQDCDISGVPGRAVPVHFVLLHADIGAALLDLAPAATQGAEATLRRRLDAARFEGIFPGHLPVVHLRIAREETDSLGELLDRAFATLPPLSVAGGDAWVGVVRRALSPRDPARGATYRGMSSGEDAREATREDWPARPQLAAPHGAPQQGAPPHGARTAGWGGEAPGEAGVADDPTPRPRPVRGRPSWARRPRIWAASAAAGLVAVGAAGLLATGWTQAQAPMSVGPSAGPARPSPVAPIVAAAPGDGAPGGGAPASGAQGGPATASGAFANSVPAVPASGGQAADTATARPGPPPPAIGGAPPGRTTEAASPRPDPASVALNRNALAGSNAAAGPAETTAPPSGPPSGRPPSAAPTNEAGRVVVTSAVNLRSGPAKTFAVLRTAPRGEAFRVHDRAPGNWILVGEARPEGWLYGEMVRDARP